MTEDVGRYNALHIVAYNKRKGIVACMGKIHLWMKESNQTGCFEEERTKGIEEPERAANIVGEGLEERREPDNSKSVYSNTGVKLRSTLVYIAYHIQ
jgi:hypothetical protein